MMQNVEQNLKSLGIELPNAPSPAANYVPFVKVGQFLYVSGQISQDENGLITGKITRMQYRRFEYRKGHAQPDLR